MKVGKSKVSAQLNVNNLLDHEYFTQAQSYASSLNTSAGYNSGFVAYGAPRTFMGSIGIQY